MKITPDKDTPFLIGTLFLGLLPHMPYLPFWVNAWCFSSWGFVLAATRFKWPLPSGAPRFILTIVAFTGVLLMSGRTFDNDSGIALLSLMASLKPFEIKSHRDKMVTIFIAYFMVIASLFFSISLFISLYMFCSVVLITATLIHVNHPDKSLMSDLKLSATITVQALPLMLIFFFLFPRLQGNLWGIQKRASGSTGFSDTLSPGSVTNLAKNKATAFRVSFKEGMPAQNQLYWRGIVFQHFDGKEWKTEPQTPLANSVANGNIRVDYSVIMEPHARKWLFVLDLPCTIPSQTRLRGDNTLVSKEIITKQTRFSFSSNLEYKTGALNNWERITTMLPREGNQKSRLFAQKIFLESASQQEYIHSVLSYFSVNEFYYTLKPPLLKNNPIDDFLFDSRQGYCEHYASAFVFLMRSVGIPARIVGGYMGGEINPYGSYLIVRQVDAHAWAEVWFENEGWVRYDPTASVAPERIETGMAAALPPEELPEFLVMSTAGRLSKLFNNVRLRWDAVNYLWNTKIIGYTHFQQKQLLSKFGIHIKSYKSWTKVMFLGICLTGFITALFFLLLRYSTSVTIAPVLKVYLIFCRKLARAGIIKEAHTGPRDFAAKAITIRPDLTAEINSITHLYILLRYKNKDHDRQLYLDFKNMVRQFRITRQ